MLRNPATKPYDDFPLTAHKNGQWCKKVRGTVRYFGPVADWKAALEKYLDQRDDLQAGRKPRSKTGGVTLADVLNRFLYSKKLLRDSGELAPRSYGDYERTCDRVAAALDKTRLLSDLGPEDFQELRAVLSKGRGPTTIKMDVGRARMIFLFAAESGLAEKPILYRKTLKAPSQRVMRKQRVECGPRMFEPDEINALLAAAPPQIRAMIYLGINCGFGNTDCGTLPFSALDLKAGWHRYWRPKTHNPRRCPLWPETIEALKAAIADRPAHKSEDDAGFVFITKYGHGWCHAEEGRNNPLSHEFRKLLVKLGIYREKVTTFYSLRRTFETIGATAGEQVAVDHIMGHVADSDDMAAVYRQRQFDGPLRKVTGHVRDWLQGRVSID
jgi:integrase